MSVDVRSKWECDWCGTFTDGRGIKPPDGWTQPVLLGVDFQPDRDLCRPCTRKYHEALKELKKVIENFWWKTRGAIPAAPDARPPGDLD